MEYKFDDKEMIAGFIMFKAGSSTTDKTSWFKSCLWLHMSLTFVLQKNV